MLEANFDLRGWESNDVAGEQHITSLLGILWDKNTDVLFLSCNFSDHLDKPIIKRKILAITHKVFDPLRWMSPALQLPKLLLHDMWKIKLG